MRGLVFVGMLGPDSHNREEERFVEELAKFFSVTHYLRGAGVKGLRPHHLVSLPSRLASRKKVEHSANMTWGSLYIVPVRQLALGLNVRWIQRQLRNLVDNHSVRWTLWIRFPSPELVDAVSTMPQMQIVYEPIDLYSAAEDLSSSESRALIEAERKLICLATVVTGGRLLADRFADAAGGTHWLPFGGDERQPSYGIGVPAVGNPRIGLVGCLDWRLDESVLVSLALEHPDWQLILAGPRVRPWGRRLKRLPNVHWLGRIPIERVRPVIRDCDVTLVPYRVTDWTRHCLPVKVFEYLAEGKPVIATPLPELEVLADVITVSDLRTFADSIQAALETDSPLARERRRQAAVRFTLQDRARGAIELTQCGELKAATP